MAGAWPRRVTVALSVVAWGPALARRLNVAGEVADRQRLESRLARPAVAVASRWPSSPQRGRRRPVLTRLGAVVCLVLQGLPSQDCARSLRSWLEAQGRDASEFGHVSAKTSHVAQGPTTTVQERVASHSTGHFEELVDDSCRLEVERGMLARFPSASTVRQKCPECNEYEGPWRAKNLHFKSPLIDLTFYPEGGPRGFGLLLARVLPSTVDNESIAPVLDTIISWTQSGALARDFVSIIDISKMVRPSVWTVPQLLDLLKAHAADLEPTFLSYQQCFAVLRGNSVIFNALVDAIIALFRVQTVPIFATGCGQALKLLLERFA